MKLAKQRSLRANWLSMAFLGLVVGCGGPGMPTQTAMAPPEPPREMAAATAEGLPPDTVVSVVELRAEGSDRQVLQSGSWLDRIRSGRTHSVFGGDLGFGYSSNGLLPFVSNRRGASGISFADLNNRTVYDIPVLSDDARNPVLSRGGRFVVYEEDGDLQVLDLRTQLVRDFSSLGGRRSSRDIRDFDIDNFGNVTYIDENDRVHVLDTDSGRDFIVPAAGRGLDDIDDVSISGNGRFVVFTGREGGRNDIFLTDLTNGRQYSVPFVGGRGSSRFGFGSLRNFELSPTGDQLLFSDGDRVRLLDLRSGFIDNLALLNTDDVDDARFLDSSGDRIVFERDGDLLVFDRGSNLIDTLPVINRDGGRNLLRNRSRFNFGRIFD